MKLLRCFCCKTKDKTQAAEVPATTDISNIEEADQTSKLTVLRDQLRQVQTVQASQPHPPVIDHVIGVVDIPVYESDGVSLRSVGKSHQLFVYDK